MSGFWCCYNFGLPQLVTSKLHCLLDCITVNSALLGTVGTTSLLAGFVIGFGDDVYLIVFTHINFPTNVIRCYCEV